MMESKNNMNKAIFRLTESELREMIKESAQKILSELDWRTYDSARVKAEKLADSPDITKYEAERRKNQAKAFRSYANDVCNKHYGVDKINKREEDHNTDVVQGKRNDEFAYTNGELKRLDKQARDVQDYYDGRQVYRDGKWTNESKEQGTLTEAVDPIAKIQSFIDQANSAYHQAVETQGGEECPLMDKEGTPYGLSSDIKLDGHGYVIIPFNGGKYSSYQPTKIRVLTKVGGKIKVIQGDYYEEGWRDVKKMLTRIVKDAQIGNGNFQNYDPNWENAETPDEYKANKEALRSMNKQIGRRANTGLDYINKGY